MYKNETTNRRTLSGRRVMKGFDWDKFKEEMVFENKEGDIKVLMEVVRGKDMAFSQVNLLDFHTFTEHSMPLTDFLEEYTEESSLDLGDMKGFFWRCALDEKKKHHIEHFISIYTKEFSND